MAFKFILEVDSTKLLYGLDIGDVGWGKDK